MKYSIWYLNLALWLRHKIRRFTFNRKYTQHGTFTGKLTHFFEVLLDIRHQETFSRSVSNRYAQKDMDVLEGYNTPKI